MGAKGVKHNETIQSRFLRKFKINPSSQCWEWTGAIVDGYGMLKYKGKMLKAHRISYRMYVGELPDKMLVCHKCDNRKCVNPFHFFLGSIKDNMYDAQDKGRIKRMAHPSYVSYSRGCRCDDCKMANAQYLKSWIKNNPELHKNKIAKKNLRRREARRIIRENKIIQTQNDLC